jgi:hypothetical protein
VVEKSSGEGEKWRIEGVQKRREEGTTEEEEEEGEEEEEICQNRQMLGPVQEQL